MGGQRAIVIAVFLVFTLLYWNAYRQRAALALTPLDVFDARTGIRAHALSVGLGVTSVTLALTVPIERLWLSGMLYMLEGPLQATHGILRGKARMKVTAT